MWRMKNSARSSAARAGSPEVGRTDGDEVKKFIECPVCIEVYQRPKSLTCGHSLCAVCEGRLTRDGRRINCPVCRVRIDVPREGLPINYSLQDLVSELTQKKKTSTKKLHPCPVCSIARPIGEFWLCQQPSDQCANGDGRIACSSCALKLHKNHELIEVAEILNRRELAAAEWKTNVSAKLQRLSAFPGTSSARRRRLSNAVSGLVAQLKTNVTVQMQRRERALEVAVAELESDLENFAKVDESSLQLSSINGMEDLLADDMFDAKETELDQQLLNQEKFRNDSDEVVSLVKSTIARLTELIGTTDGQPAEAAEGTIDGEDGDEIHISGRRRPDPRRRSLAIEHLPSFFIHPLPTDDDLVDGVPVRVQLPRRNTAATTARIRIGGGGAASAARRGDTVTSLLFQPQTSATRPPVTVTDLRTRREAASSSSRSNSSSPDQAATAATSGRPNEASSSRTVARRDSQGAFEHSARSIRLSARPADGGSSGGLRRVSNPPVVSMEVDEASATNSDEGAATMRRGEQLHSHLQTVRRALESSDDDEPGPSSARRHSAALVLASSDSDGSVVLPLRERIQRRRMGGATSTLSPIADMSRHSIDVVSSDNE